MTTDNILDDDIKFPEAVSLDGLPQEAVSELLAWRQIGTAMAGYKMAHTIVNTLMLLAAPRENSPVKNFVSMGFAWDHDKSPFRKAELTLYRDAASKTPSAEIGELKSKVAALESSGNVDWTDARLTMSFCITVMERLLDDPMTDDAAVNALAKLYDMLTKSLRKMPVP